MERIRISMKELESMMYLPKDKQELFDTWMHILTNGFLWDTFILYVTELTQRYKVEIIGRGNEQKIKIVKAQLDNYGLPVKTYTHEINVVSYLETLTKFVTTAREKSFEELYKDNNDFIDIVPPMSFIQYMIIESKNRSYEYVESESSRQGKNTSKSKNSRQKEHSLLDAIKIYQKKENALKRKYNRHKSGWDVRGKFRRYKSGKIGWVRPYSTGTNRTGKTKATSKDYVLKSNEE